MNLFDDIGLDHMRGLFNPKATPTSHHPFKPMTAAPTTESQPAPAVSVDGQIYMLESVIEAYNQQLEELRTNGFSEEMMQRICETIAANLTSSENFHRTMSRFLRNELSEFATDAGYIGTYADHIIRLIENPLCNMIDQAVQAYLAPRINNLLQENNYLDYHARQAVRRYLDQRDDAASNQVYLYRALESMIAQALDQRNLNN